MFDINYIHNILSKESFLLIDDLPYTDIWRARFNILYWLINIIIFTLFEIKLSTLYILFIYIIISSTAAIQLLTFDST